MTVSVASAPTMSCLYASWTGDSAAETMRVPICTPDAPNANAAAMDTPSVIPPAAITGTSTAAHTWGSSTIVDTGRVLLNPPPSPPSTTRPSTPASTALRAARSDGTTWNTVMPAAFNFAVSFVGSPADVVTNDTPCSATKSTTSFGSRTK